MPGEPANFIRVTDGVQVLDPAGEPSPLIILRTDPFTVGIEFRILTPQIISLLGVLAFRVRYTYESIGGGAEGTLGDVTRQTVAGQPLYNATTPATPAGHTTALVVAANTLAEGVYRLAALVSFRVACPHQPATVFAMTGFTEGPAIEIFQS
jgi:hypothetical protein